MEWIAGQVHPAPAATGMEEIGRHNGPRPITGLSQGMGRGAVVEAADRSGTSRVSHLGVGVFLRL